MFKYLMVMPSKKVHGGLENNIDSSSQIELTMGGVGLLIGEHYLVIGE